MIKVSFFEIFVLKKFLDNGKYFIFSFGSLCCFFGLVGIVRVFLMFRR